MPAHKLDSALMFDLEIATDIADHDRMAKQKNAATAEKPRFLTLPEIAHEARVSLSTVRHWIHTGALASTKLGRHRRVARTTFEAWIAGGES